MLHVVTWKWGDKYSPDYVQKLGRGLKRNISQSWRWVVMTDGDTNTIQLPKGVTLDRSCFVRLQVFGSEWQEEHGVDPGDKILSIDVDCVVTGPLDPLVEGKATFLIMQGGNFQPCPYNGALQMLVAGKHQEVWDDFSLEAASKVPFSEWPDDQGWLWHKIPDAMGWKTGSESGVFVFHKPGWPDKQDELPPGARVVAFAGKRSPAMFAHLPWVKEHWR